MPPDYSQNPNPNYPPMAPQVAPQPSLDFMLNPEKPSSFRPSLFPRQSSPLIRAVVVLGGALVLLIVIIFIKGLIFKGPDMSGFITVAQDQQSIITLITNAASANQLSGLSDSDQNLAATAQIVLPSNQSQVVVYLKENGHKISSANLSKLVDSSVTSQLSSAQAAGDYDTVFASLMKEQLNTYINDLNKTYPKSGKRGKVLLSKLYNQAELMISQLA